jgi:hypothetical protein
VNFENCKKVVPITTAVQFMSLKIAESHNYILPRIIRIRDAPFYLGMDKNRFNAEVRPTLTELKIGTQGVAFDRLELDAWVDDLISRTGNKTSTNKQEKKLWDVKKSQVSLNRRVLAYRQNHQRTTHLPKHWHKRPRRSGTLFSKTDYRV